MRATKILLLLILISASAFSQQTIYSLSIDSLGSNTSINLSSFTGKKILITNLASGDTSFRQFEELKQLNALYPDSLVIIVIPVNNFGTEAGNIQQLDSIYRQPTDSKILITAKLDSLSVSTNPLYQWLTSESVNGVMGTVITHPGYKFLIKKSGTLKAVFSSRITPLDPLLKQSIERTSNN